MNLETDSASTDECYVTALQIFDYCGAENSGSLRFESLMDKFSPFVKTNKAEYSFLKSLLDPNQDNPEISVEKLANALRKYSESQKAKFDLDESFNLKIGQGPQDSDSGISTDGYQLLEELQSELREKAHLVHQLKSQLDFSDRQHEEALGTLVAERDSLRTHLNMLREENVALAHVRRDYEETCDRLCGSEQALEEARKDLESVKRQARIMHEQLAYLESEKLSLQELLAKSKDECHRINEMYATRQATLIEENETLKTEHANLTMRLQDQEEFMQQTIKEKVMLEVELNDVLNKSNQTHLRLERSIDVSYTDDQMLTALDSLNADSKFTQDAISSSTQTELPCLGCEKRDRAVKHRSLKKLFWDAVKSLFQVFAVLCFACALFVLYGVTRGRRAGCLRDPLPWRWLDAGDLIDLLFRIEYVSDVPM